MEDLLRRIVSAGLQAPSGENCQPWKVKFSVNGLDLYNDPEKDKSLYNFDQKGSMVAQGAFIENLVIASKQLGLSPQINLFPDPTNKDWVAKINFIQSIAREDRLHKYIFARITNRKFYKKVSLTNEQRSSIIDSSLEIGSGTVILLEDPEKIKTLAEPISLNERLIFENQNLHNFFYDHIRWNKEEDQKYKNGFYIETLELKPPQRIALKILRSWKWALIGQKIGISKQIARDNAKNYASASALGIVVVPNNDRKDFVIAGRIMERVWLKVTSMGLSLQPMTGVLFFMQKILSGQHQEFTYEQDRMITEAYEKIRNQFKVRDQTIAMLFRIGHGGEPSARSSRFKIEEIIMN